MIQPLKLASALLAATALAACGGGSSSKPVSSPFAYPTSPDAFDAGAGDDTPATASTVAVGATQVRTFFPDGDVDWVKVTLVAGTKYEFSANRLSANSDTYLYLYDTDGSTQLAYNDDYVDFDSDIVYTPTVSGDYYLEATTYNNAVNGDGVGVARYTLGAHVFVDEDGDGFSTYHDCNDQDATVFPRATETAADGIDQNCDGLDAPDGSVADGAGSDGTAATAGTMAGTIGDPWEIMFMTDVIRANARTIAPSGDTDWFKLSVPAWSAIEIVAIYDGVAGSSKLVATLHDSDATTVIASATYYPSLWAQNDTAAAKTFYVEYAAASGVDVGYYAPTWVSYGTDVDRDTYYTPDWDTSRDCNDSDAAIHPGAAETPGDGIDSNCNGLDDT
ncbi:MAG TPA: MopE-related protein [Anaeromyxobacteraceae bacterium]|nr:MopE-related protein [Anaeromyxobacteraceae bacterium]